MALFLEPVRDLIKFIGREKRKYSNLKVLAPELSAEGFLLAVGGALAFVIDRMHCIT